MRTYFKYVPFLLIPIFTFIHFAEAQENNIEIDNEGIYGYSFQYDYKEIYNLLKLSEVDYEIQWKKGLSISEMAEKQGVERGELMEYFVTFHYNILQEWKFTDNVPENLYFTQVYRLDDEINEFIDRNPNKD